MKKLELTMRRANNSAAGNPRFQIIDWNNQSLFEKIIANGFIRDLKRGFFTESNSSYSYSIGNKDGFIINDILISSIIKY